MKLKSRCLLCFLLFIFVVSGCSQPDLLRYGNRANCLGSFDSGEFNRSYNFPVQASYAKMTMLWHEAREAFVLKDENAILHLLNQAGTGEIEQINDDPIRRSSDLALAENYDVAAFTIGASDSATIYVIPFGEEIERIQSPTINKAHSPVWSPNAPMLAAIYYPEGYQHSSNIVALFEVTSLDSVLTKTYELADFAISGTFGWSPNGQIIAVSQYDRIGLIPYYLFPEDGTVKKSLYNTSRHNCVRDAQWSPIEQVIAFAGENDTTQGWDIFLEEVTPPKNGDGSIINLTNTPGEDERNIAWSPDGEQIVYMKGYEDAIGNLHQELFFINVKDTNPSPIQLTDTLEEFETDPVWISDTEIAYLSWSPTKLSWSLNVISIFDHVSKPIMRIPPSWYEQP